VVPVTELAVWVLSGFGDGCIRALAFHSESFGCLFWKECVEASDHCILVGGQYSRFRSGVLDPCCHE